MTNARNMLNIVDKLVVNPDIKIILDTNIFLNYLWDIDDKLKVLINLIKKYSKSIVFTEQTIDELRRNLSNHFEKNKKSRLDKLNVNFPSLTSEPISAETKALRKRLKESYKRDYDNCEKRVKENINLVNSFIENDLGDFVIISRTDNIIKKAIKRSFVGNPPYSNKKTVGDEIIWESLLAWGKNNIVIVTQDKGFLENQDFLKHDYKRTTGLELVNIYDDLELSDALAKYSDATTDEELVQLRVIENDARKERLLKDECYQKMSLINELMILSIIEDTDDIKILKDKLVENLGVSEKRFLISRQNELQNCMRQWIGQIIYNEQTEQFDGDNDIKGS